MLAGMMSKGRVGWAAVVLFVLAVACGGCNTTKTYEAYAAAPPENPAELTVGGNVRFVTIDGRTVEDFALDTAGENPPPDIETYKNPKRLLKIDPGDHTLVVGLGRRWYPTARNTHIGMALLTGHVNYQTVRYPGSAENVELTFTAEPGKKYGLREVFDGDTFEMRVVHAGQTISTEVRRLPAEDGSEMMPADWLRREKELEQNRRDGGSNGNDLTKPKQS